MLKQSFIVLLISFGSYSAFSAPVAPADAQKLIESTDCATNPQSCRNLTGLDDLKKLCTNFANADRQLPPTRFEYQCKMCWTEWKNEEALAPMPLIITKQSNLITNKGKFNWKSGQSSTAGLNCLVAKEVIHRLDDMISVDLSSDLNCQKVLTFNSDKDFHDYLEQAYCSRGYLQQQGLEVAAQETGRFINTCTGPGLQSSVAERDVQVCPDSAVAALTDQAKPVQGKTDQAKEPMK